LAAAGAEAYLKGFGPVMEGFDHVAFNNLNEMRAAISEHTAAILVEPVQGEGGVRAPSGDYLKGLRAICDEFGLLLVYDEVQSGMGRTGKLWACEHSGVQPDILTSAKGIASGMPLGATFASREIMSWPPGAHASTFGGNPVSCAAALKTLELLDREYTANAAATGEVLLAELQRVVGDHPRVGDIRGRGLMIGVELVKDKATRERDPDLRNKVVSTCFEHGLLILGCGRNTIRFASALTLSPDEARLAVELFAAALNASA
jgi:4-aminobutyrate aminotransferase